MLMSAMELQRAYEDNERVCLCTSVEVTPTSSSLFIFSPIPSAPLLFLRLPIFKLSLSPLFLLVLLLVGNLCYAAPFHSHSLLFSLSLLFYPLSLRLSILCLPSFDPSPFFFLFLLLLFVFCISSPLIFCLPRFLLPSRFSGFTFCVTSALSSSVVFLCFPLLLPVT